MDGFNLAAGVQASRPGRSWRDVGLLGHILHQLHLERTEPGRSCARPAAPCDTFQRHAPSTSASPSSPVIVTLYCAAPSTSHPPPILHQVENRAPAPLRHCGRNRSGHPHPEAGRGRPASVLRRQVAVRRCIHCAMHYYMQKVLWPGPRVSEGFKSYPSRGVTSRLLSSGSPCCPFALTTSKHKSAGRRQHIRVWTGELIVLLVYATQFVLILTLFTSLSPR